MKKILLALALALVAAPGWAQDIRYYPAAAAPGGAAAGVTYTVAASNSTHAAGADYTADGTADEVQINAAIQALPATGGRVLLLDGTYTINAPIVAKSGMWLQGQGAATIVKIVTGHAGSISIIDARANGANSNVTISDLTLDGNSITTIQGIYVAQSPNATLADNVRIERCTIKSGTGTSYGVLTFGTTNLLIQDNLVIDWGDSVLELKAGRRTRVARNALVNGTLQLYAQTDGVNTPGDYTFANNVMKDADVVFTNAGTTIQNVVVSGNTWVDTDDRAANAQVLFRYVNNATVTGNTFDSSGDTSYTLATVVLEATATNVVFADNVIRTGTNTAGANGYDGLTLASPGALVVNNTFTLPGDFNDGIKATSAATGAVVRGNRFIGTSGVNGSCIDLASTASVTLQDNICDTFGGTAIKVAASSTGTTVIDNRMLGTVATPYGLLDTTGLFRNQYPMAFAALPADVADGSQVYCSDCTIASPCADSGTGALAKRLSNAWVCN
jgi:hypothetical protein